MDAAEYIHLKILLPYQVFAEVKDVKRMVVECSNGSNGFLPNRLDCTGNVVPGILMYESQSLGETYLAIDEGTVVKAGKEVFVSVRNAIGGKDLGTLHKEVEKEFVRLDEREKDVRSVLAKLEGSFMHQLTDLQKGK